MTDGNFVTIPTEMERVKSPLEQVVQWLIQGETARDVLDEAANAWPDHDPDELYELAVSQIKDAARIEPELMKGFCLLARREIFRRMMQVGDLSGALRAIDKIEAAAEKLPDITP